MTTRLSPMPTVLLVSLCLMAVCAAAPSTAVRLHEAAPASEPPQQAAAVVRSAQRQPWGFPSAQVLALGGAAAVQVLLIGSLLLERRRRRRAEGELVRQRQDARTQLATITHLDRRASLGEVTAAITHELNQPLEAILHNAEAGELLLEAGSTSVEEVRHILADIRRIDMRAAEIIQRLRGLLRRHEFETRSVDINELARETADMVTSVAGSKGVRIDLDTAPDLSPVAGDRIHLQQVLVNLLLNGIEAMCATAHERRVLVVRTSKADRHVEVSVTDRGPGIAVDAVDRIFEPFYTTKGQGMGIGLSIGRTIVEAHGGVIAARNNDEEGATVWFTLPADDVTVAAHQPRRAAAGRQASVADAVHGGWSRLVPDHRLGSDALASARTHWAPIAESGGVHSCTKVQ